METVTARSSSSNIPAPPTNTPDPGAASTITDLGNFSTTTLSASPKGVGRLFPKRLRRKRDPGSVMGIARHQTFNVMSGAGSDAGSSTSLDRGEGGEVGGEIGEGDHGRRCEDGRWRNDPEDDDGDEDGHGGYGSDTEISSLSRPQMSVSAHPSQVGYLTTSSPIVQAAHLPTTATRGRDRRTIATSPTATKSEAATRPTSAKSEPGESEPADRLLVRPKNHQLAVHQNPSRRSPSPVGRIKDIFSSSRKSSSLTVNALASASQPSLIHPSAGPRAPPNAEADPTAKFARATTHHVAPSSAAATPAHGHGHSRHRSVPSTVNPTNRPETPPLQTAGIDSSFPPVIVSTPPIHTYRGLDLKATHKQELADAAAQSPPTPPKGNASPPAVVAAAANALRRARTGSTSIVPSKLSAAILPPGSPADENRPSTAGGATPTATGFFSSMISVAQNAASSLIAPMSGTNNNNNNNNNNSSSSSSSTNNSDGRPKTATAAVESAKGLGIHEAGSVSRTKMDTKDSAVKSLGTGELSLSQLGLSEGFETGIGHPLAAKFAGQADGRSRTGFGDVPPQSSAAAASEPGSDDITNARPLSLADPPAYPELSSSAGSVYDDRPGGLTRTGSMRSRLGGRRNRGGSNTTGASVTSNSGGATVGTTVASAHALLSQPPPAPVGPKLTGFAIASKKRNRDFHTLFKSVPDDDYLIEDYSCALQREILAHGRLYVSEGHLCFSSNIFGWVTTLVMSFGEIVSVEKRSTALLFKNGLKITTLHAEHVFASFTGRDATYDLIVNIWKLGHPSLQSTSNGIRLEGTGGDKTEKIDAPLSASAAAAAAAGADEAPVSGSDVTDDDDDDDEDDVYDEDDDDDDDDGATDTAPGTDGSVADTDADGAVSRKASGASAAAAADHPSKEPFPTTAPGGVVVDDFPGPTTHVPTDCGDSATHHDKIVGDDVIPAPLGQVYALMFGPSSAAWMSQWLTGNQKCTDLQMEDRRGLVHDNKSRTYSFIKPLYGALGPKQTKCIVTETLDNLDLEKAVSVSCSTLTPDVPSGNIFTTKTKYCLSWAENNSTRVQANCTVEWSGKSWIKTPIEKGANDGQLQYCKELFASLRSVVARPRSGTAGNGAAKPAKRRRAGRKPPQSPVDASDNQVGGPAHRRNAADKSWGVLEPVRPLLEPIADIVRPLATGNLMYGLLVGLLVASWFSFGFMNNRAAGHRDGSGGSHGMFALGGLHHSLPDRVAAYEELWRREGSDLWEWLEERAGLDGLTGDPHQGGGRGGSVRRRKAGEARTMEERLREEGMDERETENAIRVTEDRLRVLKEVVARRKQ